MADFQILSSWPHFPSCPLSISLGARSGFPYLKGRPILCAQNCLLVGVKWRINTLLPFKKIYLRGGGGGTCLCVYLKRPGASDPLDLEIQEVVSGDISTFSSQSYLVQECFCYGFLACTLILCITQTMITETSKLSAHEGTTELRDSARQWDGCLLLVCFLPSVQRRKNNY